MQLSTVPESPAELRELMRRGELAGPTSGMAVGKVQRFFTIVGNEQAITLVFQGLIEDFEVLRIVIHEQNRHLRVLADSFSHKCRAG